MQKNTHNDREKGAIRARIVADYNQKAPENRVVTRSSAEQKGKWRRMTKSFTEKYARRRTSGRSGSAVDIVYDKLEDLLKKYPSILPQLVDNLPSDSAESSNCSSRPSFPSVSDTERQRPDLPHGLEPPSTRRRTEKSSPTPNTLSSAPPPINPPSVPPPPPPPPPHARSQQGNLSDMEAMLNRVVESQRQFQQSLFEDFQASMERRNDLDNHIAEALIASLDRTSDIIEQTGLIMRELNEDIRRQRHDR
ncbi:hypothetical protein MFLAVUS_006617 [Mucor flavus]|uniref:Uncharacterized protein n=1 Tax=Mucor flavus TaxID=439312 RepID=A0ABP9Z224_9FUNG